jgi:hypothetical protein
MVLERLKPNQQNQDEPILCAFAALNLKRDYTLTLYPLYTNQCVSIVLGDNTLCW